MAADTPNAGTSSGEDLHNLIDVSQEVIQGLLEILGEAWNEIDRLKQQNTLLRQEPGHPASSGAVSATPGPRTGQSELSDEVGEGILIIDDSKVLQMRLKSTVESLGFKVIATVDEGLMGSRLAVSRNPRLVILDYNMPGMNGLECTRQIKAQKPQVRIIICSAEMTWQIGHEFKKLGVDDIVSKPIQLDNFIRAVKRCMGERES